MKPRNIIMEKKLHIKFKTKEEKEKQYRKKHQRWKKRFLFLPTFAAGYDCQDDTYRTHLFWLCFMEKYIELYIDGYGEKHKRKYLRKDEKTSKLEIK